MVDPGFLMEGKEGQPPVLIVKDGMKIFKN